MFDVRDIRGEAMNQSYAETRRYWEPVVEITQIKGDSETHPVLSPDDAFADFETYPYYIQREWTDYIPQAGDYIRSALKTGLALQETMGVNPYQFGVIGSTDAHTALPSAEEDNFHGKMATDSIPSRKSGGWSDDARGTFRLGDERLRTCRCVGHREHPRGHYRGHASPRGVCDQRAADSGENLWRAQPAVNGAGSANIPGEY